MAVVIDGTAGITSGPISGTTGSFSGNVLLGSSVLAPAGSAPSYTCRAWVNFNGTGTVAIRASGNVSSITDLGVGIYRVTFATDMPDTNFSCTQTAGNTGVSRFGSSDTFAVSSVRVKTQSGTAAEDAEFFSVSIFR